MPHEGGRRGSPRWCPAPLAQGPPASGMARRLQARTATAAERGAAGGGAGVSAPLPLSAPRRPGSPRASPWRCRPAGGAPPPASSRAAPPRGATPAQTGPCPPTGAARAVRARAPRAERGGPMACGRAGRPAWGAHSARRHGEGGARARTRMAGEHTRGSWRLRHTRWGRPPPSTARARPSRYGPRARDGYTAPSVAPRRNRGTIWSSGSASIDTRWGGQADTESTALKHLPAANVELCAEEGQQAMDLAGHGRHHTSDYCVARGGSELRECQSLGGHDPEVSQEHATFHTD